MGRATSVVAFIAFFLFFCRGRLAVRTVAALTHLQTGLWLLPIAHTEIDHLTRATGAALSAQSFGTLRHVEYQWREATEPRLAPTVERPGGTQDEQATEHSDYRAGQLIASSLGKGRLPPFNPVGRFRGCRKSWRRRCCGGHHWW